LKLIDEAGNLRGGEDVRQVSGDGSPCYFQRGHGGSISLIQTPGDSNRAGVNFGSRTRKTTGRVGRKDLVAKGFLRHTRRLSVWESIGRGSEPRC
jgi:hypothetical protein